MAGLSELLLLLLVLAVLAATGLLPHVTRALRELRGEIFDEPAANARDVDLAFKMLGISSSSSWEEIERAYRSKAKLHHPDRGGDEDTMRALNDAYTLIKRIKKTHRAMRT